MRAQKLFSLIQFPFASQVSRRMKHRIRQSKLAKPHTILLCVHHFGFLAAISGNLLTISIRKDCQKFEGLRRFSPNHQDQNQQLKESLCAAVPSDDDAVLRQAVSSFALAFGLEREASSDALQAVRERIVQPNSSQVASISLLSIYNDISSLRNFSRLASPQLVHPDPKFPSAALELLTFDRDLPLPLPRPVRLRFAAAECVRDTIARIHQILRVDDQPNIETIINSQRH